MSMQKLIELENDRLKFIKKIKTMKKKRTSTKEGVTPETVQIKEDFMSLMFFRNKISIVFRKVLRSAFDSLANHQIENKQKPLKLDRINHSCRILLKTLERNLNKSSRMCFKKIKENVRREKIIMKLLRICSRYSQKIGFIRLKIIHIHNNKELSELQELNISKIEYSKTHNKSTEYIEIAQCFSTNTQYSNERIQYLNSLKEQISKLTQTQQKQIQKLEDKVASLNQNSFEWKDEGFSEDTEQILLGKYMRLTFQLEDNLATVRDILKNYPCDRREGLGLYIEKILGMLDSTNESRITID